ncbi:Hydrogen cyanide synthase subunit HcnB [Ensifer psoraleae]|uniref:FAD-dependent oxidoreductase n=1 Tax=Sinorhizobium psoraleae TaxID=520838 RepID=UPI00156A4F4E|nr:FAD-dependent oxidoreductase [Sinorhizobium psoraleae]NRP70910.1 Hydrogen cyanide synthase subunit HcnB [Sinorhizobium psoraleae]
MSSDVIVIGAGPAGMTAAIQAAEFGLSVLVLDEQPAPGGQRFRDIEMAERQAKRNGGVLDKDDAHGALIARRFRESGVTYLAQASVWDVAADPLEVSYLHQGSSFSVRPEAVVVATGALERPVPIPGWMLPGVMTAGAAQLMLKTSGRIPEGRVALLGCGPLLLLAAKQLLAAGADVVALLQTTALVDLLRAAPYLPSAFLAPKVLLQGLRLLGRTTGINGVASLQGARILGKDSVTGVEYTVGGRTAALNCDVVLLHFGVVPNTQITQLVRADHVWNDRQLCWQPVTDVWQETSIPNVMVAGDGRGIFGADAAGISGRLSVLNIAYRRGAIPEATKDRIARDLRGKHERLARARAFMDIAYRPPASFLRPNADVILCRCEEVLGRDIQAAVANGASGMRRLKAHTRAGMGVCRGQMCSMATSAILSEQLGAELGRLEPASVRPPLRPLTAGQLASTKHYGD